MTVDRLAVLSRKKMRPTVALALLLFVYALLTGAYLVPRAAIANLDFWYHLSLAQQLDWGAPGTLVDGLYPLGYPFLLRIALGMAIDALRAGQFLSWLGGLLSLGSLFIVIHKLTRSTFFALAGTFLLALNGHFLTYATVEGNDMLATGLQAAALASLFIMAPDRSWRWLVFSGLLLGSAYLARYTALLLLPAILIFLIVRGSLSRKTLVRHLTLFLLVFLVVTAVQWLPSWIVQRNPLYNTQAQNVWFGIYGENDWVNNWNKVPETISLADVIALDPPRFIQHWLQQLQIAMAATPLWSLPLHVAWILALPVLLLTRQVPLERRMLLILAALVPLTITALAWLQPRFLLLPLWCQAVLITWIAYRLPALVRSPHHLLTPSAAGLLLVAAIALQWEAAAIWFDSPPLARPHEVNRFLRSAGMEDPATVATNDPYLHATDLLTRTRYAQTYFAVANPGSVDELLSYPAAAHWQFLVLDYQNGFGHYANLRNDFIHRKGQLVPLLLSEQRDIFCIIPCSTADADPITLRFNNGMLLGAYQITGTSSDGSVYLYWEAEQPLERSYKVSIRILDSSGRQRFQVDNIPQQWTYPTTSWPPAILIADFHTWRLEEPCTNCQLALVVYDEATGQPVLATSADNQSLGPLIPVATLSGDE